MDENWFLAIDSIGLVGPHERDQVVHALEGLLIFFHGLVVFPCDELELGDHLSLGALLVSKHDDSFCEPCHYLISFFDIHCDECRAVLLVGFPVSDRFLALGTFQRVEHENQGKIFVPHHLPEVGHCFSLRCLARDECWGVALD